MATTRVGGVEGVLGRVCGGVRVCFSTAVGPRVTRGPHLFSFQAPMMSKAVGARAVWNSVLVRAIAIVSR